MPWSNGGGVTREIAVHPPGAGWDAFAWRVSLADVTRDGPYSPLPGVRRILTVVDGAGLELTVDGAPQLLPDRCRPFAFPGAAATDSRLLDGPAVNLNAMLREGRAAATVEMVRGNRGVAAPGPAPTAVRAARRPCWSWPSTGSPGSGRPRRARGAVGAVRRGAVRRRGRGRNGAVPAAPVGAAHGRGRGVDHADSGRTALTPLRLRIADLHRPDPQGAVARADIRPRRPRSGRAAGAAPAARPGSGPGPARARPPGGPSCARSPRAPCGPARSRCRRGRSSRGRPRRCRASVHSCGLQPRPAKPAAGAAPIAANDTSASHGSRP